MKLMSSDVIVRTTTAFGRDNSGISSVGERLLHRHLRRENFLAGVDRGLWRMLSLTWPHAVFVIGEVLTVGESEIAIDFSFEGYPITAPTVQLWDLSTDTSIPAHAWPTWFIEFITNYYPGLVKLELEPYSPALLTISTAIVRQLKQRRGISWSPSGDITQVLCPLVESFSSGRHLPSEYPLAG
jgi:hypothetical protein